MAGLLGDIIFAAIAMLLIVTYTALFLGSCSPIHCRLTVALTGIFCVLLSCITGFGIVFLYDWKLTELSNTMPVLILGIGVDDMFVICNAIDQTPFDLPASERFKRGM